MAIMTKMRDNMPVILIGLVVVFIITIVFEWGMDYLGMSRVSDTVGIIEGRKVSYQEFSDLVRQQAEQYKQQTKQDPDEQLMRQIRDQVWNSLVTQALLDRETKRMGVTVTDQEIIDWVRGENPPEFLVQQFRDSTGQFRRDAYESALNDPRNKDIWIQVETALRQQRLAEKVQSIVFSSLRVTEGEMLDRFVDQNVKADLQYAVIDPNAFVTDEQVSVTDEDLRREYAESADEFKMPASRKLKYVLFSDQPSARDSQDVQEQLKAILNQAKSGIDFTELQQNYAETSPAPAFFKHGELTPEKEDALFSAKVGELVGPVSDNEGFHLFKVLEERKGNETFVKARHILLNAATPEQEKSAMTLANELIARAKRGEDFSALARQYSTEPGASVSGGELGWFGKGRMVKPFEDAAFAGRPGQVLGPVKTQFGVHVVKVDARDNRELKVAAVSVPLKASARTKDEAFQRAQDFAYVARKGSLEQEAQSLGLNVQETPDFQKGAMVPGIGLFEPINKFAFRSDVGDISDAYQAANGYAVVKLVESKKEGVRPFDDVKESLRPRVLRKKKMAQAKAVAQEKYASVGENGDIASLASDPKVAVRNTGEFSVGGFVPTLGREFSVIGAVKRGAVGRNLGPIEGQRGWYIVRILNRTAVDTAAYAAQKSMLAAQVMQEKKQQVLNQWFERLKESADIEDNRDTFFR